MGPARARREAGRFVCEGLRLSLDAVRAGIPVEEVFLTDGFITRHPEAAAELIRAAGAAYAIDAPVAERLGDTRTPQGVFALCRMGEAFPPERLLAMDGPILGCECIQDPGNLGGMLRTAAALGFAGAILIGEGADPFSPKALRASMGAAFRLPLGRMDGIDGLFDRCAAGGIPTFAAIPSGGEPVDRLPMRRGVLLIGNEGNGLSERAIAGARYRATLPMAGGMESLNATAAATILMWEMTREGREDR